MEDHTVSPFNAVPRVVVALAAVIFGLEVMFQAASSGVLGGQGGIGWRLSAIQDFGVFREVAVAMLDAGVYPPEHLLRLVTYPLIHGGFIHAAFVVVFVLAIGKMVAEVFSPLAFLAVFFLSSVAGALGFVFLMTPEQPLYGGYPGAYGLIGAFTFLMWIRLGDAGPKRYRVFGLVGALIFVQILFGVVQLYGGSLSFLETLVANIVGFVVGFALSFVVSPGGWRRVLARLRER